MTTRRSTLLGIGLLGSVLSVGVLLKDHPLNWPVEATLLGGGVGVLSWVLLEWLGVHNLATMRIGLLSTALGGLLVSFPPVLFPLELFHWAAGVIFVGGVGLLFLLFLVLLFGKKGQASDPQNKRQSDVLELRRESRLGIGLMVVAISGGLWFLLGLGGDPVVFLADTPMLLAVGAAVSSWVLLDWRGHRRWVLFGTGILCPPLGAGLFFLGVVFGLDAAINGGSESYAYILNLTGGVLFLGGVGALTFWVVDTIAALVGSDRQASDPHSNPQE